MTPGADSGTAMTFALFRPAIFTLDAERAHRLTIAALKAMPLTRARHDPILASRVAGIDFPSPIGLAAGFDKDGEVPDAMLALGFGFVEIGSVTPLPQPGNPRPRVFRLPADRGVINRMGFNNDGQARAHARLSRRPRDRGVLGVNIGANKDAVDRIADYAGGVRRMADVADYLTINISSPNTPGLRGLQDAGAMTELLDAATEARGTAGPPIFLKLAPDLEPRDIDAIVRVAHGKVDALIIGNTTISRPDSLVSAARHESGGLSGAPLRSLAAQRLRDFRQASGGTIALIAAGGIDSGAEAYARIRAGAALIQLYSAMVYHGPGIARHIARDLAALLRRDGIARLSDAIGIDAP